MKEIIISALLLYTVINLNAQVGINTTNPKTTFDVQYSGMNTIPDGVRAPLISLKDLSEKGNSLYGIDQKGTIIYVTDINGDNTSQRININKIGYYFFDGIQWNALGLGSITTAPAPKIGTIKDSFIKTDHEGWYLLDGRSLTLLTNSVKKSAESVGINSNLPDATDKMMITTSKVVDIGMNGGKNGLRLEKQNLPNFTINSSNKTITTKEDGEHSHSFSGSSSNTEHSHQVYGYSSLGGDHIHNFGGYSTYTAHTHNFNITSSSEGSHGHVYKGPADSHNGRYNSTADAEWDITTYEYAQTGRAGSHIHQVINTTSDPTSSGYSNHTHSVTNTSTSYGGSAHTHYFNGSTDYNSFNHNHAATVNNVSVTNAAHTFTANILGSLGEGETINNRSEYVAVNKFIYLGF